MSEAADRAGSHLKAELSGNARVRDVQVIQLRDGREVLIVLASGWDPIAGIPADSDGFEVYLVRSSAAWV